MWPAGCRPLVQILVSAFLCIYKYCPINSIIHLDTWFLDYLPVHFFLITEKYENFILH